jgi:hypothetical protein
MHDDSDCEYLEEHEGLHWEWVNAANFTSIPGAIRFDGGKESYFFGRVHVKRPDGKGTYIEIGKVHITDSSKHGCWFNSGYKGWEECYTSNYEILCCK